MIVSFAELWRSFKDDSAAEHAQFVGSKQSHGQPLAETKRESEIRCQITLLEGHCTLLF